MKESVLVSIVQSHSGEVIADWSRKQGPFIDYLVVPWRSKPIYGLGVSVITECWVTRCDQDGRVHPLQGSMMFTPLDIAYPISDFKNALISATGYDGLDREWIGMLSTLLGARYTDRMTRDTTYLICKCAEGNKYARAREWHIPILSIDWLYDSALHGYAASKSAHAVRPTGSAAAQSLTKTSLPKPSSATASSAATASASSIAIKQPALKTNLISVSHVAEAPPLAPTPADVSASSTVTRHSPPARNLDLNAARVDAAPYNPVGTPLGRIEQHHHHHNEGMANDGGSSIASTRAVCGTTAKRIHPHEAMLHGRKDSPAESPSLVREGRLRSLGAIPPPAPMLDRLIEERVLGSTDRPLASCRIALSTRAASRRSEVLAHCEQLGAHFLGGFDPSCTHLIHVGLANESVEPRDLRLAKGGQKHIVHPDWLLKCLEKGRMVPETDFPYHHNTLKTPDAKAKQRQQPHYRMSDHPPTPHAPSKLQGPHPKRGGVTASSDPRNPIFIASQQSLF